MQTKTWLLLLFVSASSWLNAQPVRQIAVDVDQVKGPFSPFARACIGAGRANEGLRADWQSQLRQLKADCGFEYIRFHGIFHDDMGVYAEDENQQPIYNWQYIDKLYDFILEIEMKPFVELSFMPAAMTDGEETVFWWQGNINPPRSFAVYHQFIEAFVRHLTERYGHEEVKTWYFEVWNEPNLHFFFSGTQEEYFEMYRQAVTAIKAVSAEYRVGGPATAGVGWITETLEYTEEHKVPLDFISTHAYNVKGFLDEFGKNQLIMLEDPEDVVKQVLSGHRQIEASSQPQVEYHITEWSSSYSPRDPVHDTYQNAPFVLNTLKKVEPYTTSMSYWVFTDIFEESGIPQTPFHGGFGLMNLQGIKKPTYFVYEYLNQMGNTELQVSDESAWACKQGEDVQVLLWDFTYPDQGGKSNQVYYRMKHPAQAAGQASIQVRNLTVGTYSLAVYKTGYLHNDVFSAYYDMGLPAQLSRSQEAHLKSMITGAALRQEVIQVENGSYTLDLSLNQNDVVLVKLTKL
ncbi:MAG: glycoside hydrolase [Bacteroidota bacterium]